MSNYRSVNPSDVGDVVTEFELGSPEDLVAACAAAREAQPAWASVPAPVRGRVISAAGRIVEANKEALARLVTREIGKPYAEALGEVQEIIDTCDFFLGEGRRLYGQTVPSEMADKQLFTFRVPVGVVAVVTAGNFPVAVPSWYVVPALLCGNAVVWKPAEYAGASAQALFGMLLAAGVPAGALNLVLADGASTFAGLEQALGAGLVDKIGFTGSTAVGPVDRRAGRPPPAEPVPRARRQEPYDRDAGCRPGPGGRRGIVLGVWHRRATLHLIGDGHRARVPARRSSWIGSTAPFETRSSGIQPMTSLWARS